MTTVSCRKFGQRPVEVSLRPLSDQRQLRCLTSAYARAGRRGRDPRVDLVMAGPLSRRTAAGALTGFHARQAGRPVGRADRQDQMVTSATTSSVRALKTCPRPTSWRWRHQVRSILAFDEGSSRPWTLPTRSSAQLDGRPSRTSSRQSRGRAISRLKAFDCPSPLPLAMGLVESLRHPSAAVRSRPDERLRRKTHSERQRPADSAPLERATDRGVAPTIRSRASTSRSLCIVGSKGFASGQCQRPRGGASVTTTSASRHGCSSARVKALRADPQH